MGTALVLGILGGIVYLSVRSMRKEKQEGGACGSCGGCSGCSMHKNCSANGKTV